MSDASHDAGLILTDRWPDLICTPSSEGCSSPRGITKGLLTALVGTNVLVISAVLPVAFIGVPTPEWWEVATGILDIPFVGVDTGEGKENRLAIS